MVVGGFYEDKGKVVRFFGVILGVSIMLFVLFFIGKVSYKIGLDVGDGKINFYFFCGSNSRMIWSCFLIFFRLERFKLGDEIGRKLEIRFTVVFVWFE